MVPVRLTILIGRQLLKFGNFCFFGVPYQKQCQDFSSKVLLNSKYFGRGMLVINCKLYTLPTKVRGEKMVFASENFVFSQKGISRFVGMYIIRKCSFLHFKKNWLSQNVGGYFLIGRFQNNRVCASRNFWNLRCRNFLVRELSDSTEKLRRGLLHCANLLQLGKARKSFTAFREILTVCTRIGSIRRRRKRLTKKINMVVVH